MRFRLLLPLILLPCAAFSQTTSTGKVCFTPAQAAQVADSLKQLPLVRAESRQWQLSTTYYHRQALSLQVALDGEHTLTADAEARAAKYRTRAHRKGWLLAALLAAATAFVFTR